MCCCLTVVYWLFSVRGKICGLFLFSEQFLQQCRNEGIAKQHRKWADGYDFRKYSELVVCLFFCFLCWSYVFIQHLALVLKVGFFPFSCHPHKCLMGRTLLSHKSLSRFLRLCSHSFFLTNFLHFVD